MIQQWISRNLQAGPFGPAALTSVIWSVLLPFTLYRKAYVFSLGYAFSVAVAAVTMLRVFPIPVGVDGTVSAVSPLLVKICLAWGLRLGLYLLVRERTRKVSPNHPHPPPVHDNGSVPSRVLASLLLAPFYAMMLTPALYAMRGLDDSVLGGSSSSFPYQTLISQGGAAMAIGGVLLETVADLQNYIVKQRHAFSEQSSLSSSSTEGKPPRFVGPTGGVYQICRHPNYMGEVLVWTGLFVGGSPFFGGNVQAWIWSGLGWVGIVSVMNMATSRLERRQREAYLGQKTYDDWTRTVRGSLLPYVP